MNTAQVWRRKLREKASFGMITLWTWKQQVTKDYVHYDAHTGTSEFIKVDLFCCSLIKIILSSNSTICMHITSCTTFCTIPPFFYVQACNSWIDSRAANLSLPFPTVVCWSKQWIPPSSSSCTIVVACTYCGFVKITGPVLHEGSQVDQHSILQQWGINPSTTSMLNLTCHTIVSLPLAICSAIL